MIDPKNLRDNLDKIRDMLDKRNLKFDIDSILKQSPDIISQVDKNIPNIYTLKVSYSKIEEFISIIRKGVSKYERESS